MQPQLAALHKFEVLHGIRHVDIRIVDARFCERLAQHAAGRTDKGQALLVFLVARLLAYENERCVQRSAARYHLRCVAVQVAALARGQRVMDGAERVDDWHEWSGARLTVLRCDHALHFSFRGLQ